MALSTGFFQEKLKLLPAMLPDTSNQGSLTANQPPTNIFSYANLKTTKRLVTLRSMQAKAVAGVDLYVAADGYASPAIDTAAASLISPDDPAQGFIYGAVAASRLQATVQNTTNGTVTNFWSAWTILAEKPSLAQRLKFPSLWLALSPEEQALASKYGLSPGNPRGVLPRTFEWVRDNEYKTQIVAAVPYSQTLTVAPTAPSLFVQETPKTHEMLVLTSLAVSPGTGTDGLTVLVGVDNDTSFLTFGAYAAGQGKPLPLFVQAEQQLTITCTATVTTGPISLSAVIWHCRMTDEISYRLGHSVAAAVQEKIDVGVL